MRSAQLYTQIEVIEKDTKQALEAISQSLSTEYGEEMEKRVNELEAQMNEIIASKVLEVVKNLPQGGTGAGGGTSMKRVLHSLLTLQEDIMSTIKVKTNSQFREIKIIGV